MAAVPRSAAGFLESREQQRVGPAQESMQAQRGSSPPQSAFDELRPALSDHRRRQSEVAALKVPVPPTVLNRDANPGSRPVSAQPQTRRRTRLDDTESIGSITTTDFSGPLNVYNDAGVQQRSFVDPPRDELVNNPLAQALGPAWQQEVEEEREYQRQQNISQFPGSTQFVYGQPAAAHHDDQGFEDDRMQQPQGQLLHHPAPERTPKIVRPLDPPFISRNSGLAQKQTATFAQSHIARPLGQTQPQAPVQLHLAKTTKSSSLDASSEDEILQPVQPKAKSLLHTVNKRPRTEETLDYSPDQLQKMDFSTLESQIFTHDPRDPSPAPVHDSNGQPLTLANKLSNMSRMPESSLQEMFRHQTDDEREETGNWLMQELTQMMRKLLDARVERRKISTRFEMEIKRRLAQVQRKDELLDEELAGLRKGGEELVRRGKGGEM